MPENNLNISNRGEGCCQNNGGAFGGLFSGDRNCGCGCSNDNTILFFIIIFLLLFTNFGCCGCGR